MTGNSTEPVGPVVGIGEVLWDIIDQTEILGGAPANFCRHFAQIAGRATLVSAVGRDSRGASAIQFLSHNSVDTHFIQELNNKLTGTVAIDIDSDGIPQYEIMTDVAWDYCYWNRGLQELATECRVVCFGTLGQRSQASRLTHQRFLGNTNPGCWRIFDVNLRQHYFDFDLIVDSLRLANVLKLNQEELGVVCETTGIITGHERDLLEQIYDEFQLKLIVLTKGADGAAIYSGGQYLETAATANRCIVDTVGAGDAFLATIAFGLIKSWELAKAVRMANAVASFVCTQPGATPRLPDSLLLEIQSG